MVEVELVERIAETLAPFVPGTAFRLRAARAALEASHHAELVEVLAQTRQALAVYQPDSAPTFYMEAIWAADEALAKARTPTTPERSDDE